jgi:iron-sulfur cluster repair protein YtfE (RIC family)
MKPPSRNGRDASEPRTVTALLQADHQRLDAVVDAVRARASEGSFGEARERFVGCATALRRHIDVEEQILFPAFEAATGMKGGGPTFVMRREHVEIRRLLDVVAASLEGTDVTSVAEASEALVALLGAHNRKEEHVLYPMTDAGLDAAAASDLVERLRAGLTGPEAR